MQISPPQFGPPRENAPTRGSPRPQQWKESHRDLPAILAQIPVYLDLISRRLITVEVRTFPLARAAEVWTASARSGNRVVVTAD